MQQNIIFIPVLLQILLTAIVYIYLAVVKLRAAKNGELADGRRDLFDDAWPESVIKVNNNIRNQFEVPVLFYALCFIFWALGAVNWIVTILSFLFVATRYGHAYVHTGSNYVPIRRRLFMIGTLIILLLTLYALVILLGNLL